LFIFYRHLLVCAFDPGLAISIGISTVVMHYGLMTALALTIVASFEAVGAILAVALLIMPGATARLWTDRMPTMLLLAATHAVLSTILGYWLLHPAVGNTSASGAISVAGFVLFLLSWLFTPHNGLVVRIIKRRRLRRVMAMENLVKTIDELSDQVTSASVSVSGVRAELRIPDRSYERTLLRAQKLGLLKLENQTISLTETGRAGAARLRRAHELWEQFLRQEVGLEPDHVHDAAEWIEHHLSDERIEAIDHTLHKPDGGRV